MSRLKPFDAFFLLTETRSSPWHMSGCEIFELPKNSPADFVHKLVEGMKAQQPVEPFNLKLNSTGLWPRWEKTDVDINYHVSRQTLPAPGTQQQLMTALEHFCAATLDRNVPLWECCIIEGLQGDRFAVAFKVHHSIIDGQGGLKIILRAMSHRKADKTARALWADNTPPKSTRKNSSPRRSEKSSSLSIAQLRDVLRPQSPKKWLQQLSDLRLFRAEPSPLNQNPHSSARRFGIGDLSLELMSSVAKANNATINDVLLTVVDAGVHRYFREAGRSMPEAMIAGMPVSTRKPGEEGGNAAGVLTIELGNADDTGVDRLQKITANTRRAKSHLRELPSGFIMGYGVAVLGMPLVLQRLGLGEKLPVVNLGVSNVSPPKGSNYLDKALYLSGARLVGLYTQPILPPSVLLNVTAASMKGKLCLGIGSTREAIADPLCFAQYVSEALDDLANSGKC